MEDRAGTLIDAIRRFTVEGADDGPNGPAEQKILELAQVLDPRSMLTHDEKIRHARALMAEYCAHMADDLRALRMAAEAYFPFTNFTDPQGTPRAPRR